MAAWMGRAGWLAMAATAGLLLCACGTTAPAAPPAPQASLPAPGSPASPAAAASTSLHGIILATQPSSNTIELEALNPATGAVTATRTFAGGSATLAYDPQDPGYVWRQAFNRGLTEMAATGPQASDGSTSAGFVNDQGIYTPLTASTSGGYGTPLQKAAIGFNPMTGDLWYQTPQGNGSSGGQFGFVNPATHVDTLVKNSSGFQNGVIGGYNDRVYFGADGYGPVDIGAVPYSVFLGGMQVERDPVNNAYQIARDGKVSVMTPDTRLSPSSVDVPWMKLPIDATQFLAADTSNQQLYVGTLGHKVVDLQPLLPVSSRTVGDAVVNPAHTVVAFVATAGSQTQLYEASLSAHMGQPRLLASFNANLGGAYGLIDWVP
ncbi:MAG TPA: hypothetical protein VIX86_03745 [Streptosporangiaceae bacterium]